LQLFSKAVPGNICHNFCEITVRWVIFVPVLLTEEYKKIRGERVKPTELKKAKEFLKGKFILRLEDSDGVCDHNPEAGSETVTCSSDGKLKTNIRDSADVLPDLMKLRIRDYTVLSSGNELTGIIAQEVQPIFPEMVSEGPEGYLMVSQPNTWELVKAIQELQTEFESLKREGIEMRDKATGEVYCVAITNGEWDKVKGSCSQ